MDLTGDLLESFLTQVTGGFMAGAVTVVVLGVVLVAASVFYARLLPLVERIRPASRGNGESFG